MKIKIGGITYTVEYVPWDDIDEAGHISYLENKIKIRDALPKEQKEAALIHEIIHAINCELKEYEVEYLAQALYQILKDNFGNFNLHS